MPELNVAQVFAGAGLGLSFGFDDILIADLNGRTLLFAYARIDARLVQFEMTSSGTISVVGDLALEGMPLVGASPALEILESGSTLLISGYGAMDDGVLLDVEGNLSTQIDVAGLAETWSATGFASAGQRYVVAATDPYSITLFRDSGLGLQNDATVPDTDDRYLAEVSSLVAFEHGPSAQILAASAREGGVTLIEVSSSGAVTVQDSFGAARGLSVSGVISLEALALKDGAYAAIAASGTSSLSLMKVSTDGVLQLTDHVLDSALTRFGGVTEIAAASVGDFAYLAAGGSDGGISLFTVLPGGQFVLLETLEDTVSTTMSRIGGLEMTAGTAALQIFVSSPWESGLTRLSYDLTTLGSVMIASPAQGSLEGTALDDQLVGSAAAELLHGGDGDDIIYDGAGQDTLEGGAGADLFVLEADGVVDYVTDFNRLEDRLDLSSFDFLYSVDQLVIAPTASGASLTFREETIHLTTTDGSPLEAVDFTDEMILNVDRPPQVTMVRTLQGGPLGDLLRGAEGFDTIRGGAGADTISGNGGNDRLQGETGSDRIDGGRGDDTIEGGDDADSLSGGEGNDLIYGGSGGDLIYGDVHDWVDAV